MLQLAALRRGETLFDLGAGDGRIIIEAVRHFGARAVGVEIDPERVDRIRKRLNATGTQAQLIEADLFQVDLSSADVITIYLSPSANLRLAQKLKAELKKGARVVSLDYTLPGLALEKELTVNASGIPRKIYSYKT